MTNMLFIILKVIVASGLLFGYYFFLLRDRQFHCFNRYYLILISLISITIPFLNIPAASLSNLISNPGLEKTLRVISVSSWEDPIFVNSHPDSWSRWLTLPYILLFFYFIVVIVGSCMLIKSIAYVLRIKKKYTHKKIDDIEFYNTDEEGTPFSFFRLIFWNRAIPLESEAGQHIFRHELFHVREMHSIDNLLMELLCTICWFNPFFHLIKKEIKAIHEFLADSDAISSSNRHQYAELLILHAIKQKTKNLPNHFFHTQIKRRITMITQLNHLKGQRGNFSRMMALPLVFILFCAFALKYSQGRIVMPSNLQEPITVLIDAGHGGPDGGARSVDGKAEKDIALSIALRIKELAGLYNIHVELSRATDILPGNVQEIKEGLMKRVDMVREKKAALFISIHMNATTGTKNPDSGFEAFISGKRSEERSAILATALLQKLIKVYTTSTVIKQQPERGIWVLDKNSCPAVLLECGNINRKEDVLFVTDQQNQDKIAKCILDGILSYVSAGVPALTNEAGKEKSR